MVIKIDGLIWVKLKVETKKISNIEKKIDKRLVTMGAGELLEEKPLRVSFGQKVNKEVADKLLNMYQENNKEYIIDHERNDGISYSGLIFSVKKIENENTN